MRICIISNYHLDSTVELTKYVNSLNQVDLYVLINKSSLNAGIFDLSGHNNVKLGFVDNEIVTTSIKKGIGEYLSSVTNIFCYIFSKKGIFFPVNYFIFIKFALAIKRKNYDAIHIIGHNPFLIILHKILRKSARVHTLHESLPHDSKPKKRNKLFLYLLGKDKSLQLIFNSNITCQRFVTFTKCKPEKCHIIYFGFFEFYRFFSKNIQENENSILFFGHIKPYKGVDVLIKAIETVKIIIPSIEVVIAGHWALPGLKKDIEHDSNYKIIDKYLSSEEIVTLIQKSQVVVCPYLSASQSGIVPTAFAFAKPVIATNVDGLPEAIDENKSGILINPNDSTSLANAIVNMLQNTKMRSEMSNYIKNIENSDKYSWTNIAKQTLSVYKKAISSK